MWRLLIVLLALTLVGCDPSAAETLLRVRIQVDGQELALSVSPPSSVGQVLRRANVTLGAFDRLNPPDFTPVIDGMLITVVRVENRVECLEESVPYTSETLKTPDLPEGATRVLQGGVNGLARVCYDVLLEDGVERRRTQSSRTILTPPVNQVVAVGVDLSRLEPIAISGTIFYISNGQARLIRETSLNQVTLPTGGNLDGFVFAVSPDGRQLLYTRKPETPSLEVFNELWVLMNTADPNAQPVKLIIDNVFHAEWLPNRPNAFSYSTLRPRTEPPAYQALNDLFIAQLDATGKIVSAEPILPPTNSGIYSQWGTLFAWSPDGERLAWAQAEGIGLVDLQRGALRKLIDFRIYQTTLARGWLWQPSLAWSADGAILAASVHGAPLGDEPPENSPVFDIAVVNTAANFVINPFAERVGMWSAPQFSPLRRTEGDVVRGSIAYLQARTPNDSVNAEYDLVIADRDGSNPRIVFPSREQVGIVPFEDRTRGPKFQWSPDGTQIVLLHQGDLHVVDVSSGRATRVTVEGGALSPRWAQ
ncbi:MAG: G5 domain-containing protein [Aggregatilineales bacterium]